MKISEIKDKHTPTYWKFYDFIKLLRKDCSDYINNKNSVSLYRGMNSVQIPLFGKKNIKKDRKSLNSTEVEADYFNLLFEKRLGVPEIRKKVAFMSNSDKTAVKFGSLYRVFPKNDARLFLNPGVKDSHVITVDGFPREIPEIKEVLSFDGLNLPKNLKELNQMVKKNPTNYTVSKLITLLDKSKTLDGYKEVDSANVTVVGNDIEIMLLDDSYYLISNKFILNSYWIEDEFFNGDAFLDYIRQIK